MKSLRLAMIFVAFGFSVAAQSTVSFGGLDRDSSQPIEIVSDQLEVDQNTGNALFTGNVVATQGDITLTGNSVQVYYTQGDGSRIDEVHATGNVTLVTPTEAAEAQTAVYDVDAGSIVMTDDVLVTQGQSAIAGSRLTVDLETGQGRMEGRVRSVIQTDTQ
ncbi:lipopolysaccharide transport periplasmic protein LptA [Palleronia abyssalis]|uniref:Lipopolysaccharide export system protein LptA n=1 Tax=Palleronia abyssalis TaxID=1501240 RepID=A0A2R8BT26_9RHOB|nr:lipopolysaccharide transport periplasmic protein LptA [Palleronia abyssalis]SPJ23278.1 Lipopolysaccharide export system protein LptA [Palleronia abyssalis]